MRFVKAFFSYLLVALVLLQTLSREVLLVNFSLNRTELAARYCVNKAQPQLHCDGKCYFAKLAKKQEERETKSAGPLKERLEMLPAAFSAWQPSLATHPVAATGYAPATGPTVPALSGRGVFHPPQRLG